MRKLRRPVINRLQPLDAQLQNYLDQLVADLNEALDTRTAEPSSLRDYVTVDYLNRRLQPAAPKAATGKAVAWPTPPPITDLTADINQPGTEWFVEVVEWTSDTLVGSVEFGMQLVDLEENPITNWISLGERDFGDQPATFGPFASSSIPFTVTLRARHVVNSVPSPWTMFNVGGTYTPEGSPALPTELTLTVQPHEKEAYILFALAWAGGGGVLGASIYNEDGVQIADTTVDGSDGAYTFWPILKPTNRTSFYARLYLLEDPSAFIDSAPVVVDPPAEPAPPSSVTLVVETTATHYRFVVSLTNPPDVPDWYEVESQILFKDAVEDPWKPIGGLDPALGSLTTDWWPRPVETRAAQVRVRSVHPQGARGEWIYSNFADIPYADIPVPGAPVYVNAPTITYNGDRYGLLTSWGAAPNAADYAVWAIFYLPTGALEAEVLLGYTDETSGVHGEWPRPTFRYNVAIRVVPRSIQGLEGPAVEGPTAVLNPTADPAVSSISLAVPVEERSGVPHLQFVITIDIPADLSPSRYKLEARYYADAAATTPISDWILLGWADGLTHKTDWWPCPTDPQYVVVRVSPAYDDKWAYSEVVAVPTGKLNLATVQPDSVGPGLIPTPTGIQINPGQGLGLSGNQVVIPPLAITEPLIAANAISTAKIMDAAVTNLKILNESITTNKIAPGAITTPLIAANAISTAKIMDEAITNLKILNESITSDKIASGAVTSGNIAANAIVSNHIAAGVIATNHLAAGAVTADKIAASAVTTDKIAANSVVATHIAAGAIATNHLAAGVVTADKIAANAVTSDKIAANSIVSSHIAAGAIQTNHLAAGAVTADMVLVGSSYPFGGTLYVNGHINVNIGDLSFAVGSTGRVYCKEVSASNSLTTSVLTVGVTASVYQLGVNGQLDLYSNAYQRAASFWVEAGAALRVQSGASLVCEGSAQLPSSTTFGGSALGNAAFKNVGTGGTEVAAGNHTHTITPTTETIQWHDQYDNWYTTQVITGLSIT